MAGMMFLTEKSSKQLKFLNRRILPAFGSLYFALWAWFEIPAVELVLGTIMIIIFFIEWFLSGNSRRYRKYGKIGGGEIVILTNSEGKRVYSLDLDDDPDNLINLDEVRFKVRKPRN